MSTLQDTFGRSLYAMFSFWQCLHCFGLLSSPVILNPTGQLQHQSIHVLLFVRLCFILHWQQQVFAAMAIFTFITYMSLFVSEWKLHVSCNDYFNYCILYLWMCTSDYQTIAFYICGCVNLIIKLLHFIFLDVYIWLTNYSILYLWICPLVSKLLYFIFLDVYIWLVSYCILYLWICTSG